MVPQKFSLGMFDNPYPILEHLKLKNYNFCYFLDICSNFRGPTLWKSEIDLFSYWKTENQCVFKPIPTKK